MSAWLLWRFAKFVGIALFCAGLWVAATSPTQKRRQWAAHVLTPASLQVLWVAGYAMMKLTGRGFEPFILQGIAASLVAGSGALLCAEHPRRTAAGAATAAAGFTAAVGAMLSRGSADALLVGVLPATVGLMAAGLSWRMPAPTPNPEAARDTLRWFRWVARLEGASLLLMVGVSMPVRMIWGISLDGGTGGIGWVHGALVLLYFQALFAAARVGRWGVLRMLAAFGASLVPGGTFVFEWRGGVTQNAGG